MKPAHHNYITGHSGWQQREGLPLNQGLSSLKYFFVDSWYALGSVLLLIGGDDSVEVGFKPKVAQLLQQTSTPISGNDKIGDKA